MRNRVQKISFSKGLVLALMCMFAFGQSALSQCNPDGSSPVINNCANKSINLDPGQCEAFISNKLFATDNCSGRNFSFSPNMSSTPSGSYGCATGTTSAYFIMAPSAHSRPTASQVTSIDLGVYKTTNASPVSVRIYNTNGSMMPNDWTLVGGGSRTLAAGLSNTSTNISVVSAAVMPTDTYAVEVIVPATLAGDTVLATTASTTAPTSLVRSPACGVTTLAPIPGGNSVIMSINLFGQPTFLAPNSPSTPDQEGSFEAGVYNFSYLATDASNNTATCTFTLTVNGVNSPVTSITCNDLVNISLDDECEAYVGADEILEGGPYSCYDDYQVDIFNTANQSVGNHLTANLVGKKLRVEVTGPNGNKCWGEILVEDKNAPKLECEDVYTTCAGDLTPGAALPQSISYKADLSNATISSSSPSSKTFIIDVFGFQGLSVSDVNFMVNIDHSGISELSGSLEGPDGTFVQLFAQAGSGVGCTNPGLFITLDDQATLTQTNLQNMCAATAPAVMGNFRAIGSLAAFNGKNPTGQWKVTINDSNAGNGGTVKDLVLVLRQQGGTIPFPTERNVTFTEIGPNTFRVMNLDPCGPATVTYRDSIEEMNCSSIYHKIIKRTWNAVDQYGNTAQPCNQYIYVYRNGLATLRFPPDYDGIDQPTLSCSVWGMTIPPANASGAGYPEGDFCENIQIFPPEDTKIDICAKSYKLIRKWKIVEWCSSEVIEHTQIIKVEDTAGPQLTCPSDTLVSTDPLECSRDFTPQMPTVSDAGCSDVSQIKLVLSYYFSADGTLPADAVFIPVSGTSLSDLPLGVTYYRWTATDDCKNTNSCTRKVTVRDQVPPVAVCDQFTVVSVGSNGEALVDALTFDDGSYDNCELRDIKVAKMTNRCPGENTQFKDNVLFCCTEVGTSVMVQLRVTDVSGNSNTCMVEAKIADKLPPYITCPANLTIDCYDDFKDLTVTGEPDAVDNCEVVSINFNDSGDVDNCGEGTIRRTWTIRDRANFSASCVQIITLEDSNPFTARDITWPRDYDATTCNANLDPDNLPLANARPRLATKNCSLTSMTYKDQVFTFVDGSCEKILRTWTIIDWCTYNENTGAGIYTYPQYPDALQIIKLTNTIKPVFDFCGNRTVDVFGNCEGEVEQEVTATDDCTPEEQLKFEYTIDANNDNIGPFITGATNKFKRVLPIGVHKITWTVEDKCGNKETCTYLLTVRDGKKPTPYCLTTVTTVVMPSTKMIEIWAKDFDYGSYDNCTPKSQLKFSFTANERDSFKVFTCEDIVDGIEMYIPITMYVTDNAGNKDFCSIGLILQDNTGDACEDVNRIALGGKVVTEAQVPMKDVLLTAEEMSHEIMLKSASTMTDGSFSMDISEGADVKLFAEKNTDIMNGVSTLDLVMIQRHILALSRFTSPYKTIAADINNDAKISASDLVALRKVILGIDNTFPNDQQSWRFVDKAQTFADVTKPFPYTDAFIYENVSGNKYSNDFIGVKIGDVNASAKANLRDGGTSPRTQQIFELSYEVVSLDEVTTIHIIAEQDMDLTGFQAALQLNRSVYGIQSGILAINENDYIFDGDILKLALAPTNTVAVKEGDVLMSITTEDHNTEPRLASQVMASEVYNADLETKTISLRSKSTSDFEGLVVYQNQPNPFNNSTSINLSIGSDQDVVVEIFDVTGKKLYHKTEAMTKGHHTVVINGSELGAQGVLFCHIGINGQKEIKKMVRIVE